MASEMRAWPRGHAARKGISDGLPLASQHASVAQPESASFLLLNDASGSPQQTSTSGRSAAMSPQGRLARGRAGRIWPRGLQARIVWIFFGFGAILWLWLVIAINIQARDALRMEGQNGKSSTVASNMFGLQARTLRIGAQIKSHFRIDGAEVRQPSLSAHTSQEYMIEPISKNLPSVGQLADVGVAEKIIPESRHRDVQNRSASIQISIQASNRHVNPSNIPWDEQTLQHNRLPPMYENSHTQGAADGTEPIDQSLVNPKPHLHLRNDRVEIERLAESLGHSSSRTIRPQSTVAFSKPDIPVQVSVDSSMRAELPVATAYRLADDRAAPSTALRQHVVNSTRKEAAKFMSIPYGGAANLGQERTMPTDPHNYPLFPKPSKASYIYGDTRRISARCDPVDAVKLIPKIENTTSPRDFTGRHGCPNAVQPPRLVQEFSTYVFKHHAAAPPGQMLRYVHMGSIATMPDGGLIVAFQASTLTEGAEDQRIYLSFSRDGSVGQRWTEPRQLPVRARGAQWAPVLHVHPKTGNVWLFYAQSSESHCLRPATAKFPPRFPPGGDIMVTKTHDGNTWQDPRHIFRMAEEGGTPKVIANSVYVSRSGTWMLPFWRESHYFNSQTPCHTDTGSGHGVLLSRDDGRTWVARGNLTMENSHLYEGTLAELGDGSVMMIFRTQLGAAAASRSLDDGNTWSDPLLLTADNPDSKPNAINLWPHGELLMAYNDHTKENIGCKNCRSKLAISRLVNETGAWDHMAQFGPSPSNYLKVHYPSMAQHGCRLLVVYSSMYACCAPFNDMCDCAPPNAEVGLHLVSYKIWEGTANEIHQFSSHRLRVMSKKPIAVPGLWGNRWWSTQYSQSLFSEVLLAKAAKPLQDNSTHQPTLQR